MSSHFLGGVPGQLRQAILDTEGLTELVELVLPRCFAIPGPQQSIRELLAVVGEQRGDPDRIRLMRSPQEGLGRLQVSADVVPGIAQGFFPGSGLDREGAPFPQPGSANPAI